MKKDSVKTVSKSSMSFLSGTLMSRITGGLRDISMAFCFGSSGALSAFMVAYRFSNLARPLFGENPVASGFIPHFEYLKKQSSEEAMIFFRDTFFSLSFFLIGILGLAEFILWILYHFSSISSSSKEVLQTCLIMLPGGLFLCLYGISGAFLKCEKFFFLPGFAPVAFNLVWIISVFYFKNEPASKAMTGLSFAMVLAFFLHWAVLLPKMLKIIKGSMPLRKLFAVQLFSAEVRKIIKPFFLGILGVGAIQINNALDGIFARYASLEGPAYLWYAIRLEQLPVGLFGVALSTALLPTLARSAADEDLGEFKEFLVYALRKTMGLLVPCTVALFVLGAALVNFVYGRGDFSEYATYETILCLWGYSLSVIPSVGVMLIAQALYAKKSFKAPALTSLASVGVNLILNYIFVFYFSWGAISIALATSVAAMVNFFILSIILHKKMGAPFLLDAIGKTSYGTLICSLFAGCLTIALGYFFANDPTLSMLIEGRSAHFTRSWQDQFMGIFVLGGFFVLILLSYAWLGRVQEILSVFGIQIKKEAAEDC